MRNTVILNKCSTRTTAIHEAGHILSDWWSGKYLHQAQVRMEPSSDVSPIYTVKGRTIVGALGYVESPSFVCIEMAESFPEFVQGLPNYIECIEHDLMGLMAGPVAEAMYTRRSRDYVLMTSGHGDVKAGQKFLELLPEDSRFSVEAQAIKRAAQLLREHWHIVEALADVLQAEGTVDGDTLMGLIESFAGEQRRNKFAA